MISSLFGDKMRYMNNGMVLIKKDITYLGVKDGYIYFNEKRAFGIQKTIQKLLLMNFLHLLEDLKLTKKLKIS